MEEGQSAFDEQATQLKPKEGLPHWVEPSARFKQWVQFAPHVAGQVAQVPLLQLGVAPVPQVPHKSVPPQVSGQEPHCLPRLWQVAGTQG